METGRDALDIAAKERFDAVLLDIGLPDMDGREVCQLLRRTGVSAPGFRCSAPVVVTLLKALADLASLLLLRHPLPRIGFRIECVYNACFAVLGRMDHRMLDCPCEAIPYR